jgi:hypothetical protein
MFFYKLLMCSSSIDNICIFSRRLFNIGVLINPLSIITSVIYAEKIASEEKSDDPLWELTKPIPLNNDGSSVEETLGPNPDVHYIYICTKVIGQFVVPALICPCAKITVMV